MSSAFELFSVIHNPITSTIDFIRDGKILYTVHLSPEFQTEFTDIINEVYCEGFANALELNNIEMKWATQ